MIDRLHRLLTASLAEPLPVRQRPRGSRDRRLPGKARVRARRGA